MLIELSVIVPTFNERENVLALLKTLDDVLRGTAWEIIFVDDDSADGTATLVREISQSDPRVRCIHRVGRRGLSSACVEGMLASSAPFVAVMDGDLQHDEKILPDMLSMLKKDETDIVIGSRYIDGGGVEGWSRRRRAISSFATALSRRLVHADLKDPMSGFFMLKRSFLERVVHRLTGKGFKIRAMTRKVDSDAVRLKRSVDTSPSPATSDTLWAGPPPERVGVLPETPMSRPRKSSDRMKFTTPARACEP